MGSPAARAGGGGPGAPQVSPSHGGSLAVQGVSAAASGMGAGDGREGRERLKTQDSILKTQGRPRARCREIGCELTVMAVGLCRRHYDRAYRVRRRGRAIGQDKGRGRHYRKYRSRSAAGEGQKRRAQSEGGPPAPRRVDLPLEHTVGRCRDPDCGWLTILRGGLCYDCSGWIRNQPEQTMDWRPERGLVGVHLAPLSARAGKVLAPDDPIW